MLKCFYVKLRIQRSSGLGKGFAHLHFTSIVIIKSFKHTYYIHITLYGSTKYFKRLWPGPSLIFNTEKHEKLKFITMVNILVQNLNRVRGCVQITWTEFWVILYIWFVHAPFFSTINILVLTGLRNDFILKMLCNYPRVLKMVDSFRIIFNAVFTLFWWYPLIFGNVELLTIQLLNKFFSGEWRYVISQNLKVRHSNVNGLRLYIFKYFMI